ncbi:MAG: type IV secretion system protein [Caulobacter sp.]|nr:type IV secretion system protein [Caulobacter sp.]
MAITACPAAGPETGLVESLLGSVECNVLNMAEAGYGAISRPGSPVSAALTILLTLYIGVLGFRLMIGRAPLRIDDLTMTVLKIGAVLALATSWPTYQQLVFDTLFRGPEQLGAGMLGAIQPGESRLGGAPLEGLQTAYDEMQASAAYLTQKTAATQVSPFQGGAGFGAFALNLSSFMVLMTTLGVILTAKIVLGLLLALGPIFVAFLLFDVTRGLFEGWLRAAIAFALAPMLAVLCLVGQLVLLEPHLVRLAEARAAGVVDLGPTSSILLLSMIFSGVALSLGVAVGMVAAGFRLPNRADRQPVADVDVGGSREVSRQGDSQAATSSRTIETQAPARATAIAAAAAAMERRDARQPDGEPATGRRTVTLRSDVKTAGGPQASPPLGQTYRRTAQPRRAASSVRRDQ